METITVKTYQFEELSDDAKEAARSWFREEYPFYDWWEAIYEDAADINLKITSFDIDHGTITGYLDGSGGRDCARTILDNHGAACRTYHTAVEHLFRNHHQNIPWDEEAFLSDILHDYLFMLRNEFEYLLSNESVDESIICNEYPFTLEGRRTLCL